MHTMLHAPLAAIFQGALAIGSACAQSTGNGAPALTAPEIRSLAERLLATSDSKGPLSPRDRQLIKTAEGHPGARAHLGDLYFSRGDYEVAYRIFSARQTAADSRGLSRLAHVYLYGRTIDGNGPTVPQDHDRAALMQIEAQLVRCTPGFVIAETENLPPAYLEALLRYAAIYGIAAEERTITIDGRESGLLIVSPLDNP